MSGRLVILPHKSWNVWNQDNREKVARDERLHREAEEAQAAKDKQLLQEQNLELLRGGEVTLKSESKSHGSSYADSNGQVEPFRLFEDLEKQHYARIGNEDYLKEKAQKELLQKKRDGIADWALGEGSIENSKVKPWYEVLPVGMGESAPTSSNCPRSGRESSRKDKADPMGTILKPNSYEYQPKAVVELGGDRASALSFLESAGATLDFIESKESESSESEHSKRREKKKRHKDHREERKSKKRSKREHSESSDDETKKHKKSKHNREVVRVKAEHSQKAPAVDPWADIRAKRLEREAIERKRAAVLLATVDVYGPGGVGSGQAQGYGQQYHPHLARSKR